MSRTFFSGALDTAAHWWRVFRSDGITLGFTTHDRDLWFGGIRHRAAPGMVPSAIRLTAGFEDDPSDIAGALSHDAIREEDLASGRYDAARIETGVVDWQAGETMTLYAGTVAAVTREAGEFRGELVSDKARLAADTVPLTSPSCRARFCGPGCALNPQFHERRVRLVSADPDSRTVTIADAPSALYLHGELRWLDGPATGLTARIIGVDGNALTLSEPVAQGTAPGMRVRLREGCDKTIATCSARFGNALNFQGEPFLPGNDMLAQYPVPR